MKAFIRITLFYLLSILIQQSAIAQQYPVTASTQIIPPYSVYLPDYAVPGSDKLRVILVQNDLTQPSYEVRLRMTVEMNGAVIMRTSPAFTPKPLVLNPGIPTIISGADLYDYLNSNNIDFSGGFSRETYDRTKALPEGAYRISFTAYDYRRSDVQVSNTGANIFFFQKSEPPVLNQPVCDSRVVKIDPQFLTFNWSSRNTPNPLEGSGTEYVFSLYEIKPKNSNPDYIVRSTQPLYTTTTATNTLIYGPGEPQLIDSMDYVWIVQARDKSGRDMYSNQGYSKSCKFSYLSNNPFAVNNIGKPKLNGEATGERTAKLWWPLATGGGMYNVEAYRVQYRAAAKDGEEFDWFTEEKEADSTLALYNLEPGRAYEARLQWRVSGIYGPYSDLVTITTEALRTFSCGESPQVQLPQNSQLLPVAVVGMPVKIGHFDVLLTDVSGSNGVFSGKGRIITPGFGMGLLMEFKGITINTDLVVIRGEMQAVTSGIDKFVSDAVKEQRGGADVGKVKTGDIVPDVTTNLHIFSKDNITVNTDAGTITLKDSNTGNEEVINYKDKGKTLPLVLEDADGNLYNIDKNGKVTAAGTRDKSLAGSTSALAALNTLQLDSGVVNFTAATTNRYAFDSWKTSYEGKPVLDSSYEKLANGKYSVSAKALVPGEQEDVLATLSNAGSINTDKIKFVSGKGIVYPSKKNGSTWTITITGGPAGDAQEVFAVYPKSDGQYISMGKLLVASYAPVQKKIVLVQVGMQTLIPQESIQSSLEQVYSKVGATYTLEIDTTFRRNITWDQNGDGQLQDTKSAFLSNGFTGEEKALKKAYSKTHTIDDNAVYLFIVNEAATGDGDLLGKMPRQSQFGFIFTKGASNTDIGHTIAHEVAHGAWTLEHTFASGIGLTAMTTANLMDYKNGNELLKYQWDVIHSPGHVWGIFEDDDGSGLYSGNYLLVSDYLINDAKAADYIVNNSINYVVPDGSIIRLSKDVKVTFGGYLVVTGTSNASGMSKDAIGVITGFYKDSKYWVANFSNGNFSGFYQDADKNKEKYVFTDEGGEKLVVAGVEFSKCKLAFYAGLYTSKQMKYSDFSEIKFKNDERKLIGVKEIAGKTCIDCELPLENKPQDIQAVLKELYTNPNSSSIDDKMVGVSEANLKNFVCIKDRFNLIKNIADGFVVGNDDEMSIIKLIRSAPDDQVIPLLDSLQSDKDGLLALMFKDIDGEQLGDYFSAMSQLFFRSKSPLEWEAIYQEFDKKIEAFSNTHSPDDCDYFYKLAEEEVYVTKRFTSDGVNHVHYQQSSIAPFFSNDGKVAINFYDDYCKSDLIPKSIDQLISSNSYQGKPFTLVRIFTVEKDGSVTEAYMPAISLVYVANNYMNYDIMVAVNKLIAVLAAKQLSTPGASPWVYLWATVDLVVSNGNLYIAENQDELSKTESGKKFIEKWETVNTWVAVAQGASALYGIGKNYVKFNLAVKELKAAFNEWKFKDFEELRAKNPELAAKLEAFGKVGIGKLDDLIAAYELKLQKVMQEVNCTREVAIRILENDGILFLHSPTSGAKILYDTKSGTFLVGAFNADLKNILEELNYPVVTDYATLEAKANPQYLVPAGQKFNLLNVSKEVVDYFSKKGGFFNSVNAKWIDAAVAQKVDIIVVSDASYLYKVGKKDMLELTGFGKEIHRLEWKHGFRFDPESKMMLPPSNAKAAGLPTLTKLSDWKIVD